MTFITCDSVNLGPELSPDFFRTVCKNFCRALIESYLGVKSLLFGLNFKLSLDRFICGMKLN